REYNARHYERALALFEAAMRDPRAPHEPNKTVRHTDARSFVLQNAETDPNVPNIGWIPSAYIAVIYAWSGRFEEFRVLDDRMKRWFDGSRTADTNTRYALKIARDYVDSMTKRAELQSAASLVAEKVTPRQAPVIQDRAREAFQSIARWSGLPVEPSRSTLLVQHAIGGTGGPSSPRDRIANNPNVA